MNSIIGNDDNIIEKEGLKPDVAKLENEKARELKLLDSKEVVLVK